MIKARNGKRIRASRTRDEIYSNDTQKQILIAFLTHRWPDLVSSFLTSFSAPILNLNKLSEFFLPCVYNTINWIEKYLLKNEHKTVRAKSSPQKKPDKIQSVLYIKAYKMAICIGTVHFFRTLVFQNITWFLCLIIKWKLVWDPEIWNTRAQKNR